MNLMEYASPLGRLTLAEENGFLVGLWMENQKYFPKNLPGEYKISEPLSHAADWLDRYFAGQSPEPLELPLNPQGTDFQKQVWQILCRIPYGETTTYAVIAREIAEIRGVKQMSAQAVGGAVGHNPISIIIPCHRVLGTNGALTGYAGGMERKQWLLDFEKEIKYGAPDYIMDDRLNTKEFAAMLRDMTDDELSAFLALPEPVQVRRAEWYAKKR